AFIMIIDAYAQQTRRHQNDDPNMEQTTAQQRRADALTQLVENTNLTGLAPTLGGDRPTIMAMMDYHKLQTDAWDAGVLPNGYPIPASELRRLCCDANLIPVVLGGESEPLDVGRTQRFVTLPIRKALTIRDKHCAFPECDIPASNCDAHHITSWWEGGPTNLNNLTLLCGYHHAMIEPDRQNARDQWQVKMHTDGYPIFHPPNRFSPTGPLRHADAPPLNPEPDLYLDP
ncbi:MAG: HNH endonuclease, partial [Propionibacteriaceae bacterium]|nr:HNH endonuclease [Propionibacteriaceae bacterium]